MLYALARPIVSSTSAATSSDPAAFDPITGECIDINKCRTTSEIVWSCLSVIFICTWVAIHPNIPKVKNRKGEPWHPAVVFYQNVELMVIALLVPEFMVLWAMRQRKRAKMIGKKFKEHGWGITHGFFVIMGGFALYDGDKFCGYLGDDHDEGGTDCEYWERISKRHAKLQEVFGWPERENEEREADIVQGATLGSDGAPKTLLNSSNQEQKNEETHTTLPRGRCLLEYLIINGYITLTEDEIKDRSHADVITKSIAVIQTTWFILHVIVRAMEGLTITRLEIITVGFAVLNFGTYFLWWNKPLRVRHPVRVYWRQKERSTIEKEEDNRSWVAKTWSTCWEWVGAIVEYLSPFGNILVRLLLLPLWILVHIFIVCSRILTDRDDNALVIPISSGIDDDPLHLYIAGYGIAALFGAIHCIPWVSRFPTHTEQVLWRISAVAVAAAPVPMALLHGYYSKFNRSAGHSIRVAFFIVMIVLCFAYAVLRVALIVIAFMTLRDLSPSTYRIVRWTTFIPHIG